MLITIVVLLAHLDNGRPMVPVVILAAGPIGAHDQPALRLLAHLLQVPQVFVLVDESVRAGPDHSEAGFPRVAVLLHHVLGAEVHVLVHLGGDRANLLQRVLLPLLALLHKVLIRMLTLMLDHSGCPSRLLRTSRPRHLHCLELPFHLADRPPQLLLLLERLPFRPQCAHLIPGFLFLRRQCLLARRFLLGHRC